MDVQTRTRVAGINQAAAYDELLKRKADGEPFDPAKLMDEFRKRELELVYSEVDPAGSRNLRELSLRYYGDAKYWPLIVWSNPDEFSQQPTDETGLPADHTLHVIHFLGWPR